MQHFIAEYAMWFVYASIVVGGIAILAGLLYIAQSAIKLAVYAWFYGVAPVGNAFVLFVKNYDEFKRWKSARERGGIAK